jgi:hypothetical protein
LHLSRMKNSSRRFLNMMEAIISGHDKQIKDERNKDKPNKDELHKDEPNKDELNKDKPNKNELDKDEPNKDELNKNELNGYKPYTGFTRDNTYRSVTLLDFWDTMSIYQIPWVLVFGPAYMLLVSHEEKRSYVLRVGLGNFRVSFTTEGTYKHDWTNQLNVYSEDTEGQSGGKVLYGEGSKAQGNDQELREVPDSGVEEEDGVSS